MFAALMYVSLFKMFSLGGISPEGVFPSGEKSGSSGAKADTP